MIKQDKKIYKIVAAVLGLLIFLNLISALQPINRGLGSVVNFFAIKLRGAVGDGSRPESRLELLKKITELESRLAEEKVDLALLNSLQAENQQFKSFLDFFEEEQQQKYLLADVVWSDGLLSFSNTNQSLIIDKGSRDNISPGLVVVNEDGVLVGKILEVEDNYSKMCLFSNSFCSLAVAFNNQDKSFGLSEGNLGLSIKINFIAQNEDISVGDVVFTSGLENNVPRGLYLGEVVSAEKKENDIWQDIVVEPFFGSRKLNRVAVILPE